MASEMVDDVEKMYQYGENLMASKDKSQVSPTNLVVDYQYVSTVTNLVADYSCVRVMEEKILSALCGN